LLIQRVDPRRQRDRGGGRFADVPEIGKIECNNAVFGIGARRAHAAEGFLCGRLIAARQDDSRACARERRRGLQAQTIVGARYQDRPSGLVGHVADSEVRGLQGSTRHRVFLLAGFVF